MVLWSYVVSVHSRYVVDCDPVIKLMCMCVYVYIMYVNKVLDVGQVAILGKVNL